eukprot:Nk52_evm8s89 gene=Nk52_evmTU8s89
MAEANRQNLLRIAIFSLFCGVYWLALCTHNVSAHDLQEYLNTIHYDINLDFPHIRKSISDFDLKYTGEVRSKFNLTESTRFIDFHAKENLQITKAALNCGPSFANLKNISFHNITRDATNHVARMHLIPEVGSNEYSQCQMTLHFNGGLKNNLAGAYLSLYTGRRSSQMQMLTTQFEPMDSRRTFPCFDEPMYKATFNISLTLPRNFKGLSNGELRKKELQNYSENQCKGEEKAKEIFPGAPTVWEFETTPRMSTYLVAFVAQEDFWYTIRYARKGALPVRVWAQSHKVCAGMVEWAAEIAVKVIEYFEEWYGIEYAMSKADLIAIPDFSAGAMENWGLITFREAVLLHSDTIHDVHHKQYCAMVVAHELAHQWFGNLVTMKWWDDLWLNEGFATFMEYKVIDHLFPDWDLWGQFLISEENRAMSFDSLKHSHPIINYAHSEEDVVQMFDAISYQKGSSLLRFLHTFMGECFFQKGIREYLKRHQFANAEHDDLWATLTKALSKADDKCALEYEIDSTKTMYTISSFMKGWTTQSNYPILVISDDRMSIEQVTTFYSDGDSERDKHWSFPFMYYYEKDSETVSKELSWIDMRTDEKIELPKKILKANYDSSGFYRVCYPASYWKKLKATFLDESNEQFSASDRAGLIMDVFALAKSSYCQITYDTALDFLTFLKKEKEFTVWNAALPVMGNPAGMLSKSYRLKLRSFVVSLMKKTPIFDVGKNNSDAYNRTSPLDPFPQGPSYHTNTLFQKALIEYAAPLDENLNGFNIHKELKILFYKFIYKGKPISPTLFSAALNTGTETANRTEWDKVYDLYKDEDDFSRKNAFLEALCSTSENDIAEHLLDLSLNPVNIRAQDSLTVYFHLARGGHAEIVWGFYTKHFKYIYEMYKEMKSFGDLFKVLCATLPRSYSDEVVKFSEAHKEQLKPFSLAVKQGLEKMGDTLTIPVVKDPIKIYEFLNAYDRENRKLELLESDTTITSTKKSVHTKNSQGSSHSFNIVNISRYQRDVPLTYAPFSTALILVLSFIFAILL